MIFINKKIIDEAHPVALAKTVLHEAAHAMISNTSSQYISDFFYANIAYIPKDASRENTEGYMVDNINSVAARASIKNNTIVAPDESGMTSHGRLVYRNIFDTMLRHANEPPTGSEIERKNMYLNDPAIRQSIILRNADSLAVLAMQFHRF